MVFTWYQPKYKICRLALLVLLVFAIVVYVYIYKNVRFDTWSMTHRWAETNNDLDIWRELVNQYIANQREKLFDNQRSKIPLNVNEVRRFLSQFGNISTLENNHSDANAMDIRLNSSISLKTSPTQLMDQRSIPLATKGEISTNVNVNVFLVLFTTFDDNAEKYVCRNNTLKNWKSFGALVKPVFFTSNDNLAKRVSEKGWDVLSPSKTKIGIPVLKYMFLDVMKRYQALFYAYANGDILFVDNLIDTLMFILNSYFNQTTPMLIVGRRTNVESVTEEQASTHDKVLQAAKKGILFIPDAEDYFISNQNYPWSDIPEVVVGRVAYDNWLVLNAKQQNHTTIDASSTILALHQTTKAGNWEGHSYKDTNFNANLLSKLFKKVNYYSGLTSCIPIYTSYNTINNHIQLHNRNGC